MTIATNRREARGGISSPIKWAGGQSNFVPHLLTLIPPHITFVDHTAGGLSLLLAMDPEGRSEIVNDRCGELMNFWRVLRSPESFYAFQRIVEAWPFCEEFWTSDADLDSDQCTGEVARAVAFFVRVRQSMGGMQKSFAPLSTSRVRRGMNEQASAWISAVEGLEAVHRRLRRVVIVGRDRYLGDQPSLFETIGRLDATGTLHYVDPPFVAETRTSKKLYEHEFSDADHEKLLLRLSTCVGSFMLLGYACPLYEAAEKRYGWLRHEFKLPNSASKKRKKAIQTECVWTNFAPPAKESP